MDWQPISVTSLDAQCTGRTGADFIPQLLDTYKYLDTLPFLLLRRSNIISVSIEYEVGEPTKSPAPISMPT